MGLSLVDLRALLQLYGVDDRAVVDGLVEMGKASRKRAWWDDFREYIGDTMVKFIGLESSASIIRQNQDELMPGLMQTSDYARAVQQIYGTPADVVEKKTEVRIKRQEILDPGRSAKFFFVIDESVLHRVVGGVAVMREQLLQLKEFSRQPNISIQVLPFSAGMHIGMKLGAFSVLELSGGLQDPVAVTEHPAAGLAIEDKAEQVSDFVEAFLQLEAIARPKEELEARIERAIRDLG
ncbi:hypothetical protein BBK82_20125 [Lentzea guizhouensis]|uniref:DUF5753 domain-containing protein n=1 Tax=Lentzea guizhouensis TaxID=1586287 RepID=A0A1B2HYV2_9PSEU|nr:hypothetical protein BBK82_20125 [Lentzea guizhouensis]